MRKRNFWCYRVNTSKIRYFIYELNEGRLRQDWDEEQDLRNFKIDESASRNHAIFNKVKKGDILLIPQIPNWGEVALVEATEDFNIGYKFEIDEGQNDYGHIFPVKYLKKFSKNNNNITGNLRLTLKNRSRFWNINHYSDDVEFLLKTEITDISKKQDHHNRLESSIGRVFNEVFDENVFADKLYYKLTGLFTREEWEFALVYGLRQIFPFYQIDRVSGKEEKSHGTDILIKLPSILSNYEYAIAIQVKDYNGFVESEVINQIEKSEKYWESENLQLIDKIVIVTNANNDNNLKLINNDKNVKFIFANELKQLLAEIGKNFIGMK